MVTNKQFLFSSREEIELSNPIEVKHIIMSINTPEKQRADPKTNSFTKAILFLDFHDLDYLPDKGAAAWDVLGDIKLFSDHDANSILYFAERWEPWQVVLIHCDAGASRSPAVAAALAKIYGDEKRSDRIFKIRAPNRLVYRKLMECHESRNG